LRHGGDIYKNQVELDFSVNTNPFGIPKRVQVVLSEAMSRLTQYPEYDNASLREEIGKRYQVSAEQVLCGNGASELFMAIVHALQPKQALLPAPGFYGYEHCLKSVNANRKLHLLQEEKGYALTEDFVQDITSEIDMIFLACPNNPTGRAIEPELFLCIMDRAKELDIPVVLDACFFELMDLSVQDAYLQKDLSFAQMIERFPNLLLVNAFTKTMAMPGVRLGFVLSSNPKLLALIHAQLPEWNVSVVAQQAGLAASAETSYVLDCARALTEAKKQLCDGLKACGLTVYEGEANFVMAKLPTEQGELFERLLQKKILIRKCDEFVGLEDGFVRIAVKSSEWNEKLLEAIRNDSEMAAEEKREQKLPAIEHVLPADIERNSMATITHELSLMGIRLDEEKAPVIRRCIHTAADFDYASTLKFSENAIADIKKLIREGADIVTDTNMGLSGINKMELAKYGGSAHCFMADAQVARIAKERGVTRATVSMEMAAQIPKPVIFAIGNAPTALIELKRMMDEGIYRPAFVIGVPVGFVNVVASKELILESDVPYIVNRGRKGGSNVAAAICNAILYMLRDEAND